MFESRDGEVSGASALRLGLAPTLARAEEGVLGKMVERLGGLVAARSNEVVEGVGSANADFVCDSLLEREVAGRNALSTSGDSLAAGEHSAERASCSRPLACSSSCSLALALAHVDT